MFSSMLINITLFHSLVLYLTLSCPFQSHSVLNHYYLSDPILSYFNPFHSTGSNPILSNLVLFYSILSYSIFFILYLSAFRWAMSVTYEKMFPWNCGEKLSLRTFSQMAMLKFTIWDGTWSMMRFEVHCIMRCDMILY